MLENKELLESLNKSKENAETIANSLNESMQLQKSLENVWFYLIEIVIFCRNATFIYRWLKLPVHCILWLPICTNTVTCIAIVSRRWSICLRTRWRWRLLVIICRFNCQILYFQDGQSAESRLKSLTKLLQTSVYEYISRSLFKSDRLMFILHLIHGTMPKSFQTNV